MKLSAFSAIAVGLLVAHVSAQTPTLIKDINTISPVASSSPYPGRTGQGLTWPEAKEFLQAGAFRYFVATGTNGRELYRSLGTPGTTILVKDINPGSAGSNPTYLAISGGKIFFQATDGKNGQELWVSNGSAAGTKLVKDIYAGATGSYPSYMCPLGATGKVIFYARNGSTSNYEVWISDGTSAGTVLLKDINPGSTGSYPRYFKSWKGKVYFYANDGTNGYELWVTDGTTAGTKLLKDIEPGSSSSYPYYFVDQGSKLLFRARTSSNGYELWATDGTTAGTAIVKDIRPGSSSGSPYLYYGRVFKGKVWFYANDGSNGYELWASDGTAAGTTLIKDINPGSGSSYPRYFFVDGATMYFYANDGSNGYELWKTDGTGANTVLVKDIYPGSSSSSPYYFVKFGTKVYFSAYDRTTTTGAGRELWETDGTAAGTKLVKDVNPGLSNSSPYYMSTVPGGFIYSCNDGTNGQELWKSNGTAAGTKLLKDLNPPGLRTSPSYPQYTCQLGKWTFFSANNGVVGYELWKTDGTTAGTTLVKDIWPGTNSSSPSYLARVGTKIVFRARDTTNGSEVWITDGTPAGTTLLKDIRSGSSSSSPCCFSKQIGGRVYFRANDGTSGYELYATDGTAAGTVLVKDIYAGASSSYPTYMTELPQQPGRFVFYAYTRTTGYEIYVSNGTSIGTTLLKDLRAGSSSSYPRYFTAFKGGLLFTASAGQGYELYKTDGTAAGTVLVKDIYPGPSSSSPNYFCEFKGVALFYARTSATGYELYKTDGTAAGTVLVKDIVPGTSSSYPSYMRAMGSKAVYFRARTTTQGYELWKSDGTAAGTVLVKDIWPGSSSSSPYMIDEGYRFQFHMNGNQIIFRAQDGLKGYEPWKVQGGAVAYEVGHGCGIKNQIPMLSATDPVIGTTQLITSSNLKVPSVGVLVLGFQDPTPLQLGAGCESYIKLLSFIAILDVGKATAAPHTSKLPIPNDKALIGTPYALQTWDLLTAAPNGYSLSNGVNCIIGL